MSKVVHTTDVEEIKQNLDESFKTEEGLVQKAKTTTTTTTTKTTTTTTTTRA
ncbi:hypothetical protein [Natronorubrum sp. DTA28]|uniref:hypothetical protein n=1 Tax=Natronorubrum sp. DTA28 TaxID=3447019 RepID=UPI003F827D16